jgi:hypothetical protein
MFFVNFFLTGTGVKIISIKHNKYREQKRQLNQSLIAFKSIINL